MALYRENLQYLKSQYIVNAKRQHPADETSDDIYFS